MLFRSQVVYGSELANFNEISKLNIGAAVIVTGTLVLTPDAKQPFELQASEVFVEGPSTPDYPIQPKRHSMEYLRTVTHLRPRTNTFQAVFRVRSLIAYAIHKFFQERDFVYVHTPLITGSDCEGAGEMFQVTTLDLDNLPRTEDGQIDYSKDFFGKETNLTVSGQLNGETFAQAFRNIYTFGPTFRAENSNTTRHAAEFWMIEPEIAFADLTDDMKLAEDMIKFIIAYVLEHAPEEMAFFNQFVDKGLIDRLHHVMTSDFGHVTYTEAVKLLEAHNDKFDYKVFWGCDLQTEHERYLTEQIFKRPVFVTDYPKEIKAFYMKLNEDGKTVAAMDCLVPGIGEIIGGSQREDNYDTLLARMNELGLKPEDYGFYLDLRKYGRSLLPHQHAYYCRDLHEYFPEIDAALERIASDGNTDITLLGHSTGGLIAALYAAQGRERMKVNRLVLNSPFFAFNVGWFKRAVAVPAAAWLSRLMPYGRIAEIEREKYPLYRAERENDENIKALRRMTIKKGLFERRENFERRVKELREKKARLRREYRYTARVLQERIDKISARQAAEREKQKKLRKSYEDFLKLLNFVVLVEKDDFWRSEIVQIVVAKGPDGAPEIELVPRTGSHTVIFGSPDDAEEKLAKLLTFYRRGLRNIGWEEYRTINVKYKEQVVCTK